MQPEFGQACIRKSEAIAYRFAKVSYAKLWIIVHSPTFCVQRTVFHTMLPSLNPRVNPATQATYNPNAVHKTNSVESFHAHNCSSDTLEAQATGCRERRAVVGSL